ncbi:hypothetical protein [Paraburkholderia sp. UCT2]|uniref:hypothetical protein n=1 Tax=Paraburkholderia sp. UCT2 TaxID=2615208 RepID=UPI00165565B1|nr:hypothetical protein [Paraburkholderia sp. UCT2]MBC8728163.1 hypothetical protein [Paraburkholderia sp. UCT2]
MFSLAIWISANASTDVSTVDFAAGTSVVFSQPLKGAEEKNFGSGWKRADFIAASGTRITLLGLEYPTSGGGVIFESDYPPQISPSGKYAILDVLRAGIVNPGPSGKAEVSSRQYCPVLNTASGCIVSMQTGELCGGEWSSNVDQWAVTGYKYDSNSAMFKYQFNSANELWNQYEQSSKKNEATKLEEFLVSNLGIANMMACEPPSANNRSAYLSISRQLRMDGDAIEATLIDKALGAPTRDDPFTSVVKVVVDKARLYDNPDLSSKAKMYVIKNDSVRLIRRQGEWILIEYVQSNGNALERWIACADVGLCTK